MLINLRPLHSLKGLDRRKTHAKHESCMSSSPKVRSIFVKFANFQRGITPPKMLIKLQPLHNLKGLDIRKTHAKHESCMSSSPKVRSIFVKFANFQRGITPPKMLIKLRPLHSLKGLDRRKTHAKHESCMSSSPKFIVKVKVWCHRQTDKHTDKQTNKRTSQNTICPPFFKRGHKK